MHEEKVLFQRNHEGRVNGDLCVCVYVYFLASPTVAGTARFQPNTGSRMSSCHYLHGEYDDHDLSVWYQSQ
jgi:hypothetical protein